MPLGFLNSTALVQVAAESGQASGTILAANLMKMYSRRRVGAGAGNYAWFINQDAEPQLFQMTVDRLVRTWLSIFHQEE